MLLETDKFDRINSVVRHVLLQAPVLPLCFACGVSSQFPRLLITRKSTSYRRRLRISGVEQYSSIHSFFILALCQLRSYSLRVVVEIDSTFEAVSGRALFEAFEYGERSFSLHVHCK